MKDERIEHREDCTETEHDPDRDSFGHYRGQGPQDEPMCEREQREDAHPTDQR